LGVLGPAPSERGEELIHLPESSASAT
jgi:hypothetical protein